MDKQTKKVPLSLLCLISEHGTMVVYSQTGVHKSALNDVDYRFYLQILTCLGTINHDSDFICNRSSAQQKFPDLFSTYGKRKVKQEQLDYMYQHVTYGQYGLVGQESWLAVI